MITNVSTNYPHILVFRFTEGVNKHQFETIVMDQIKQQIETYDEINLVYILDTELKNFTAGAWFEDALMGLKHLRKWNKCAIVTDKTAIHNFTEFFSNLIPGEFKAFEKLKESEAISWVATSTLTSTI